MPAETGFKIEKEKGRGTFSNGVKRKKDAPSLVILTRAHYPFSNIFLGFGI